MRQLGGDELLELVDELVHALRGEIEREELHRDEPIAVGVVGAVHRAQRAGAQLMQNAKRAERVGWRSAGNVRVQ